MQFRRWLERGEVEFVAAIKLRGNEEACTVIQEKSKDESPTRQFLQKGIAWLVAIRTRLHATIERLGGHIPGVATGGGPKQAGQASDPYCPRADSRLLQEMLSPAKRTPKGTEEILKTLTGERMYSALSIPYCSAGFFCVWESPTERSD